jgi:hypothetical protein
MTVNLVPNFDPPARTESRDYDAPLPAPLGRLPADLQAGLMALGGAGRGLFGHRNTQSIFSAHLPLLEHLYDLGASHRDVAEILHSVGITRPDGAPLDVGTVSSALSRARRLTAPKPNSSRAADRPHRGPRLALPSGAANYAADKGASASGVVTPLDACSGPGQPCPSAHLANELWSGEARHSPVGLFTEPRGPPSSRALTDEDDSSQAALRAGDLLNRLRKTNDED